MARTTDIILVKGPGTPEHRLFDGEVCIASIISPNLMDSIDEGKKRVQEFLLGLERNVHIDPDLISLEWSPPEEALDKQPQGNDGHRLKLHKDGKAVVIMIPQQDLVSLDRDVNKRLRHEIQLINALSELCGEKFCR